MCHGFTGFVKQYWIGRNRISIYPRLSFPHSCVVYCVGFSILYLIRPDFNVSKFVKIILRTIIIWFLKNMFFIELSDIPFVFLHRIISTSHMIFTCECFVSFNNHGKFCASGWISNPLLDKSCPFWQHFLITANLYPRSPHYEPLAEYDRTLRIRPISNSIKMLKKSKRFCNKFQARI